MEVDAYLRHVFTVTLRRIGRQSGDAAIQVCSYSLSPCICTFQSKMLRLIPGSSNTAALGFGGQAVSVFVDLGMTLNNQLQTVC